MNESHKTKLSLEEFLVLNEKWAERVAVEKKKKRKLFAVCTIMLVVVAIILPIFVVPAICDELYLSFYETMIISFFVGLVGFIVVMIYGSAAENKEKAKSEKIKRELYSQYLKDNGFLN